MPQLQTHSKQQPFGFGVLLKTTTWPNERAPDAKTNNCAATPSPPPKRKEPFYLMKGSGPFFTLLTSAGLPRSYPGQVPQRPVSNCKSLSCKPPTLKLEAATLEPQITNVHPKISTSGVRLRSWNFLWLMAWSRRRSYATLASVVLRLISTPFLLARRRIYGSQSADESGERFPYWF